MGSMHTGLEESYDYQRLATYFARRAQGEVGLMVTGGFAPNFSGWLAPCSATLNSRSKVKKHRLVTDAVHQEGSKIALQILHSGRYGYHPLAVSPSAIKSAISPFKPWALPKRGIKWIIDSYVNCAQLAQESGYDGIEIMGSEGYLINQFIAKHTNKRTDEWGGDYQSRIAFPLEIVKKTRKKVGPHFIIIFRLSMLDLIKQGSTWEEIVLFGKEIEKAEVNIINTGIGWHEARVPTIATMVPRAAFAFVTKKMKQELQVPLICTNRINTPEVAEKLLAENYADMVSMARPLLADPDFVLKAKQGRSKEINTCIACNQACLDHVFKKKTASCLVNPRACHETIIKDLPLKKKKNIAVIGAGPAGLSFAVTAAKRGHHIVIFDQAKEIGGQFNLAKKIPGKEEFHETLRYYRNELEKHHVELRLDTKANPEIFEQESFDEIIVATGVHPRIPDLKGISHPKVKGYLDVLSGHVTIGKKVAIIGAGGIAFDVATFLLQETSSEHNNPKDFYKFWGIDDQLNNRGGLSVSTNDNIVPQRSIFMLQRTKGKLGRRLGKTTGWIHRNILKKNHVEMLDEVAYGWIDDQGLHFKHKDQMKTLPVDHIILCAGQISSNELATKLTRNNIQYHLIGGAYKVRELDAKFAINQGVKLGSVI